ncbi:transglycosylase domain-containing protein [Terribacillus sp. AE2B 122]|uniref:transglycosylase domain-containing protein n=1 Tax=Terribacillus sp. AE2B 122 TaxID=1331902 RepID=UPI001440BAA5|nr:PBP1A family penicillin-binding protein [Terribacillus sp. AE2B 122]VVM32299.1 Multimodular transpeptidase-transglycosylase (EC 2.4.1.129) (EC 3.4.-.-) [Terribacillus sp. AE2B 122]
MAEKGQSRASRRKQKKKKRPIWKKILLTIVLIGVLCVVAGGAVFGYYAATAPKLDEEKLSDPASNIVYDMNGDEFAELGSESRRKVNYDDLPQQLVDAVTATEDSRFFEHNGIDIIRTGGALVSNFKNGFGAEGGSTIDQQVIKRSFLSPEKTVKRKMQEWWLAFQLDRQYSKEEILEMYLNKVFYGQYAYGVATAAETYFGKDDLNDLTLPETALLAGLPQRPTAYNPFVNPDLAQERMNTVLDLMVQHEKITQAEADEAKKTKVEDLLAEKQPQSNKYGAFLDQVQKELSERFEDTDLNLDGMKIYTTLDPDAQETVESALSEDSGISWVDENLQAGITLLDTKSSAIRAIGGNKNNELGGFNYAIQGSNQPGSSMKPIIDYAPAFENGVYTSTYEQINDEPITVEEAQNWEPGNYDNQFHGWQSARTALAKSYNIPAIKTFQAVGPEKAKEFANGLGLEFKNDTINYSDSIGGASEFRPIDLAGAYAAFGNEGIYTEPYTITKIEFSDGSTLDMKPESEAAMSESTAYMVTDMMRSVMTEGTGTMANVSGLDIAGKTGTTNKDGQEGSPDSWMNGLTTNYTLSIWTGTPDDTIISGGSAGTNVAKYLFKQIMTEVHQGKDTESFKKPSDVVEAKVEKGSRPAASPSAGTPSSEILTELFLKGNLPGTTSERYEEEEIDPVTGLSASYDEASNSINISWNYDGDASFSVNADPSGSTSTSDTSAVIENAEAGQTYNIAVTASVDGETSEAKSTSVTVPGEEENAEEEENPDENAEDQQDQNNEEQQNEDEQNPDQNDEQNQDQNADENSDQNNGNGNGNENNNGNGNGNDENSGQGEDSGNTEEEPAEGDQGADTGGDADSGADQPETEDQQ